MTCCYRFPTPIGVAADAFMYSYIRIFIAFSSSSQMIWLLIFQCPFAFTYPSTNQFIQRPMISLACRQAKFGFMACTDSCLKNWVTAYETGLLLTSYRLTLGVLWFIYCYPALSFPRPPFPVTASTAFHCLSTGDHLSEFLRRQRQLFFSSFFIEALFFE